ncbi:MAG: M23 family metallopeptidase [Ruminococcaceae bacterium]|nr:M23 family metallopeptidase [Oscillospiraceae bacterium]
MKSIYKGKFKVTQEYKGAIHDGLDMVGLDSKNIYSTVEGVVERAGWEDAFNHQKGFGIYVRIKQNGSNDRYYFGHLSKASVKVGQTVSVGDLIGVEGNTGHSTGSHCHYCVRGNAQKSQIRDITIISGIPNKLGVYNDDEKENITDVIYRVKSGGRWLPEVKNLEDFAGIEGKAITDVAIKVTNGSLCYRVHIYKGGWLPFVSGYDIFDFKNGYAGNGKAIDAIEIVYEADDGKVAQYRVAPLKKAYFSWQNNNETINGQDGYAGLFGSKIDKLQIAIK